MWMSVLRVSPMEVTFPFAGGVSSVMCTSTLTDPACTDTILMRLGAILYTEGKPRKGWTGDTGWVRGSTKSAEEVLRSNWSWHRCDRTHPSRVAMLVTRESPKNSSTDTERTRDSLICCVVKISYLGQVQVAKRETHRRMGA